MLVYHSTPRSTMWTTLQIVSTLLMTVGLAYRPTSAGKGGRERGIGQALIERAITEAKAKGHRLVVLVGDEPYYRNSGFKPIPKGRATMPGPVDPARLLVCELVDGASEGVSGAIRPDWHAD